MNCPVIHALSTMLLIAFAGVTRSRDFSSKSLDNKTKDFHWIDMVALRNLLDPAEDEFLRKRLQPSEFRAMRQKRLEAALEYISAAARDAEILACMLHTACNTRNPTTMGAAYKLAHEAAQLRIYAFLSMLFPGVRSSLLKVADIYEQVIEEARLLGLLNRAV